MFCVQQSKRVRSSAVNGFGGPSGEMEGRGCWDSVSGKKVKMNPCVELMREQGHTQQYVRSLKVKEDQKGNDETKYGPEPWGVVTAGTELKFPFCALKFLQLPGQARKPRSDISSRVKEGTESILESGTPFR